MGALFPQPSACPDTVAQPLRVGSLTLTGPGQTSLVIPADILNNGDIEFPLPSGFVGPGDYEIRSSGGEDAPEFVSAAQLPEPIRLTTDFSSAALDRHSPIVAWEPAAIPGTVVATLLVTPGPLAPNIPSLTSVSRNKARASEGHLWLTWYHGSAGWPTGLIPVTNNAELIVQVYPFESQEQPSAAAGITQGFLHTWVYEYRFTGVRIE